MGISSTSKISISIYKHNFKKITQSKKNHWVITTNLNLYRLLEINLNNHKSNKNNNHSIKMFYMSKFKAIQFKIKNKKSSQFQWNQRTKIRMYLIKVFQPIKKEPNNYNPIVGFRNQNYLKLKKEEKREKIKILKGRLS